eukprot:g1063.t1
MAAHAFGVLLLLLAAPGVGGSGGAAPIIANSSCVEIQPHVSHPHESFWVLIVCLVVGNLTLHVISRHAPWLPYTCAMMVLGMLLAVAQDQTNGGLGPLSRSVESWYDIDAHLILYAFLPILLFGDAMTINTHEFATCCSQCLLLAGPGVLIGTSLTAAVGYYVLPFGWDFHMACSFGAITAATDPVAVVALLNDVGASSVLTIQITGESLLNDGVAMVLFTLFFEGVRSPCHEYSLSGVVTIVGRVALCGPLVGLVFGRLLMLWVRRASNRTVHTDGLLQIMLTLTFAYLTFFVGESGLRVSGVLATVTAALVVADEARASLVSHVAMEHFWHTLEHLANSVIFFLTGLLVGRYVLDQGGAAAAAGTSWSDMGYIFLFWALAMAIRGVMLLLLYPVLKRTGYGTTPADAAFMAWGGLRGAVGLALALYAHQVCDALPGRDEPGGCDEAKTKKLVVVVGGFAFLTLLVNGERVATKTASCLMQLKRANMYMLGEPQAGAEVLSGVTQVVGSLKGFKEDHTGEVHWHAGVVTRWNKVRAAAARQTARRASHRDGDDLASLDSTTRDSFKKKLPDGSARAGIEAVAGALVGQERGAGSGGGMTLLQRVRRYSLEYAGMGRQEQELRDNDMLESQRVVYLRIVKNQYWQTASEGGLNAKDVRVLTHACDVASDKNRVRESLSDWAVLSQHWPLQPGRLERALAWLVRNMETVKVAAEGAAGVMSPKAGRGRGKSKAVRRQGSLQDTMQVLGRASTRATRLLHRALCFLGPAELEHGLEVGLHRLESRRRFAAYEVLDAFIDAHEVARENLGKYHVQGANAFEVKTVIDESLQHAGVAAARLAELQAEHHDNLLVSTITGRLAEVLLERETEYVEKMVHGGMVTLQEGHELLERINVSHANVKHFVKDAYLDEKRHKHGTTPAPAGRGRNRILPGGDDGGGGGGGGGDADAGGKPRASKGGFSFAAAVGAFKEDHRRGSLTRGIRDLLKHDGSRPSSVTSGRSASPVPEFVSRRKAALEKSQLSKRTVVVTSTGQGGGGRGGGPELELEAIDGDATLTSWGRQRCTLGHGPRGDDVVMCPFWNWNE